MEASIEPRSARLGERLAARNWNVFLGWSPVTLGYLTGLFEGSYERFMVLAVNQSGDMVLICPELSLTQAQRHGIKDIRPWADGQDPYGLLAQLADEWGFRSGIVAVDMDMPAHMVLGIQHRLAGAHLMNGHVAIAELRRSKDESEIALLKKAGSIADAAFERITKFVLPGISEIELENLLREEMGKLGGKPTFCSVAFGAASAEPHHVNSHERLSLGQIVLMDFGCEYMHYQSDITRVVTCGAATDEMKLAYKKVYEAHMNARAGIRPGVTCESIDKLARNVINDAGLGEFFIHRVGHGLGMQVHEEPYLVHGNTVPLMVGDVFSIEPGVYFPDKWGIRIENIVAVTANGHQSLNSEPSPELIEVRG